MTTPTPTPEVKTEEPKAIKEWAGGDMKKAYLIGHIERLANTTTLLSGKAKQSAAILVSAIPLLKGYNEVKATRVLQLPALKFIEKAPYPAMTLEGLVYFCGLVVKVNELAEELTAMASPAKAEPAKSEINYSEADA